MDDDDNIVHCYMKSDILKIKSFLSNRMSGGKKKKKSLAYRQVLILATFPSLQCICGQPALYPALCSFSKSLHTAFCPLSLGHEKIFTSESIFHSQVLRSYPSSSYSFNNHLLSTWARSGLCSRDRMVNKSKLNQEHNDATCPSPCSLTGNAPMPQEGLHKKFGRSAWAPGLHSVD